MNSGRFFKIFALILLILLGLSLFIYSFNYSNSTLSFTAFLNFLSNSPNLIFKTISLDTIPLFTQPWVIQITENFAINFFDIFRFSLNSCFQVVNYSIFIIGHCINALSYVWYFVRFLFSGVV